MVAAYFPPEEQVALQCSALAHFQALQSVSNVSHLYRG